MIVIISKSVVKSSAEQQCDVVDHVVPMWRWIFFFYMITSWTSALPVKRINIVALLNLQVFQFPLVIRLRTSALHQKQLISNGEEHESTKHSFMSASLSSRGRAGSMLSQCSLSSGGSHLPSRPRPLGAVSLPPVG